MLIEQITEDELRVPVFLIIHIPKAGYFHDKTSILGLNLRVMEGKTKNWIPE